MKLCVWRGPNDPNGYQNGDVVDILNDDQSAGGLAESSGLFEFVTVSEGAIPRTELCTHDYKTTGERYPASALRNKRFQAKARENLDDPMHVNNKRRIQWDGSKLRNKRYAV